MRYFVFILTAAMLFSFTGCTKKGKVVVRLNDIEITEDEVLAAYRASPYFTVRNGGLKAFLDQYISKKMILNEAERQGLDKGPEFLAEIQLYWEQELLKLTLAKANRELPPAVVTDKEIEEFFAQQQSLFPGKTLDEVREQIRAYMAREHQKQALQQWLENIKQKTYVEIDYQALGIQ